MEEDALKVVVAAAVTVGIGTEVKTGPLPTTDVEAAVEVTVGAVVAEETGAVAVALVETLPVAVAMNWPNLSPGLMANTMPF